MPRPEYPAMQKPMCAQYCAVQNHDDGKCWRSSFLPDGWILLYPRPVPASCWSLLILDRVLEQMLPEPETHASAVSKALERIEKLEGDVDTLQKLAQYEIDEHAARLEALEKAARGHPPDGMTMEQLRARRDELAAETDEPDACGALIGGLAARIEFFERRLKALEARPAHVLRFDTSETT